MAWSKGMYRSFAEDSVWLVSDRVPERGREATSQDQPSEEVAAWAAVYVDDIFVAGPRELAYTVAEAIRNCWQCTELQEAGASPGEPARFLGIDLEYDSEGNLTLTQEAYLKELGSRYSSEV